MWCKCLDHLSQSALGCLESCRSRRVHRCRTLAVGSSASAHRCAVGPHPSGTRRVAAAWWLGFHDKEPRKHLVFTKTRGAHARSSATAVIQYCVLLDQDVVVHDGLRTTSAALTVLDASIELGIAVIDRALLSGRVSVEDLEAAHARYPRRHGATRVATYLRLLGDGARSEAERLTVKLFNAAGIVGWVANLPVGGYVVDFAFPELKVGVEIDGLAFHSDDTSFQRDRTKRNALTDAGWTMFNYTYGDVVDRAAHVAEQVNNAIKRDAA